MAGRRRTGRIDALSARVLLVGLLVAGPARAGTAEATGRGLRSVRLVGDSMARDSRAQIVAAFRAQGRPFAHLDVKHGLSVDDIRSAARATDGPEILLLVLGTAPANAGQSSFESTRVGPKWENDLRGLLRSVSGDVACIRVFDVQPRRTGFYLGVDRHSAEMNAATRRALTEFDNGSSRAETGDVTIPVSRGQALRMLWHHTGAPAGTTSHRWTVGPTWLRGALD
jgi:hypothetical protein